MISIIDFIKMYIPLDRCTKVYFQWIWKDESLGVDEEYSFEGTPSEFVEKYTEHYDCLDGLELDDFHLLKVVKDGWRIKICIDLFRD